MLIAIIMPESVNSTPESSVPSSTDGSGAQSAAIASTAATSSASRLREIAFEPTNLRGVTGETASNEGIRWLFSSSTMAPMKNSPIAAGSEKMSSAAAAFRHASGSENSSRR